MRDRAAALGGEVARIGTLAVDLSLVERIARADESSPFSPAALIDLRALVQRLPTGGPGPDPVLSLLRGGPTRVVRRFAARLLDGTGTRPTPALARELIGDAAVNLLWPYFEYSAATHLDVLDLRAAGGRGARLPGGTPRRPAVARPGAPAGGDRPARMDPPDGWHLVPCADRHQPRRELSFVVAPAHARLIQDALGVEPAWERHLVLAHGSTPGSGTEQAPDETVKRFRGYNVAHAELLNEILAVEHVNEAKARRILALLERVVADFAVLYASTSDDAGRVAQVLDE